MSHPIPFLKPNPPRLSTMGMSLSALEDSGKFSNYGPVNTRFEADLIAQVFGGDGACLTVCNATIGLMIAIEAVAAERSVRRRYALMPSFTFAATAQAAIWCGFTPLFCDVDPQTWTPCADHEERLLAEHGEDVGLMLPYATFGNGLDLERYAWISDRLGIPVVVDAAASLGTVNAHGAGFGQGFAQPVVFSMHVTKTFSTSEGGVIYADDTDLVKKMRAMGNFGFTEPRSATMLGLNSKLSEIGALLAQAKLPQLNTVAEHRQGLAEAYQDRLPGWEFQRRTVRRQSHQFMPVLLPRGAVTPPEEVASKLAERGIGVARYFAPHLAQQPFFRQAANHDLPITDALSGRVLSLPMHDDMSLADVEIVCAALREVVHS